MDVKFMLCISTVERWVHTSLTQQCVKSSAQRICSWKRRVDFLQSPTTKTEHLCGAKMHVSLVQRLVTSSVKPETFSKLFVIRGIFSNRVLNKNVCRVFKHSSLKPLFYLTTLIWGWLFQLPTKFIVISALFNKVFHPNQCRKCKSLSILLGLGK